MNRLLKVYNPLLIALMFSLSINVGQAQELNPKLKQHLQTVSQKYEVDESLVYAVIEVESGFNPNKISHTGDYGLMQINKVNHKNLKQKLGIKNIMNAEENITAGVYMLGTLKQKYKDDAMVLLAYNRGETGAKRYASRGNIYKDDYVRKVRQAQQKYKIKKTEKSKNLSIDNQSQIKYNILSKYCNSINILNYIREVTKK